jgi:hypothetical protein
MLTSTSIDTADRRCLTPEEILTRSVAAALRQSGLPPLQYLDVETRDGHVYLTARVPTLMLARGTSGLSGDARDSSPQELAASHRLSPHRL